MATSSIWYSQTKSEGRKTTGRCITLEYTVDTLDSDADQNNKISYRTAPYDLWISSD